MILDFMCFALF